MSSINEVRTFWEDNPLWSGESSFDPGSIEFFEEHRSVYYSDCFAGRFDIRFLPPPRPSGQSMKVLDLGCGIGFWACEFGLRGLSDIVASDLTENALRITRKRLKAYGVKAKVTQQDAEKLAFNNEYFDHVNCQGVIHHTPNTETAISEIARVLKQGGTACISVYYRNPILIMWPYFRWVGWILEKLGGGLKGRGREKIFLVRNADEIVRQYDGSDNPIGKSYSKQQFIRILEEHFIVQETYLHFFPARALPIKVPIGFHRWLDRYMGFMIYAVLRKCSK